MKLFLGSMATLALLSTPMAAQAQLFGNVDNNTLLGGAAGAGVGAVIGSQIAPSGNRTEGSAIGAVAGGLLGAAYGNSQSNYYGNPYAGQFNPGFNQRNLIGTGIGAGLGGVIGSNVAGSGQRQEGTAIGAVLGGLAGYTIANRTGQSQRYGSVPTYPAYGQTYSGYGYGQTYQPQSQPQYQMQYQPQYQPRVVYSPAPRPFTVAQPNVYLGPSYYQYNHATQVPAHNGWSSPHIYYIPPATLGCSGNVCRRPARH